MVAVDPNAHKGPCIDWQGQPRFLRAHLRIHHRMYVGDLHTLAELVDCHDAAHVVEAGGLLHMAPHRHPDPVADTLSDYLWD